MSFKLQVGPIAVLALSLTLAPVCQGKPHASLKVPTCEKLIEGQGPNSNDGAKSAPRSSGPQSLTPMKLSDDSQEYSVGNDGTMKATVSESVETKDKDGAAAEDNSSVIGNKNIGDKLLKDAKKVNVAPLALIESDTEAEQKASAVGNAETAELTDLWQSTIARNPDIQFVINRLQPTSDPNHSTASAMRMLSGALFSAIQAVPMMMPGGANMGMYAGTSAVTSSLSSLMGDRDAKNAKKQAISQEQATMLYKIVRETADHLVKEYRSYKKQMTCYSRATGDLQDLQAMVAATRDSQDAAKQVDMEYTLRKAQRDLDSIGDDARLNRQGLVDLAGEDAVAKLDKQLAEEQTLLQKLCGNDPNAQVNTNAQQQMPDQLFKIPPRQTATMPGEQSPL